MQQGSDEWLAWRLAGLGSSDAPAIMNGRSPYLAYEWYITPFQLWMDKCGKADPQPVKLHMRRGKENETLSRAAYEKRTGHIVQPACVTHKTLPWMRASTDGGTFDGALGIELKWNNKDRHALAKARQVPPEHLPQCDHLLAVTGWQVLHYFSWREDDPDGALVEVYPSSDRIAKLIAMEAEFWVMVLAEQPPALTDRDVITRDDPAWKSLVTEYRQAETIVAEWERKKEAAREAIVAQMGEAARVTGGGVSATRYWRKGNVNYTSVPELRGVDLEPYRQPSRPQVRITVGKDR